MKRDAMKVGGFTQHHHRITAEITHFTFKCVISVPHQTELQKKEDCFETVFPVWPSDCLENTCAFVLYHVNVLFERVQNRVACLGFYLLATTVYSRFPWSVTSRKGCWALSSQCLQSVYNLWMHPSRWALPNSPPRNYGL